jgi:hypothetical protein
VVGGGWGWGLRVFWSAWRRSIMDSTSTFMLNNLSTDPNFDFISSIKNSYEDESDYFSMPYEESNFSCTYIDPLSYVSKFNS